ncbi:hypothetical protein Ddye_032280 [Dipteronia dyeriana]|uniref:Uncharacterized protein n=1 Tax=Dipteronia dyeriana TaxID=168575 RepID=A0AAD9WPD0_9ROSI|nr:hypothetical protein Ddye_032280 [Dipteronia dyeriana]
MIMGLRPVPPIDETFVASEICMGNDDQIIKTRCTPSRLSQIVDRLSEEQKEAVRGLGFGNLLLLRRKICGWLVSNFDTISCSIYIHGKTFALHSSLFAHVMGVADIGDPINIYGGVPNKEFWESRFVITSRAIFIKDIETHLEKITTSDYEFKVTFCLFLLGTILAPTANYYVNAGYLMPLSNVDSIRTKNWSDWCFTFLCDGIKKYKSAQNCYLSGCLLFLQVRPQAVNSEFDPPRLVLNTAHGTSADFNSQPGSSNSANPIDQDSVLQMVLKQMQLLQAELQEVKSKLMDEKSKLHEDYTKEIRNVQSINMKQKHDMDHQKEEFEQQAKELAQNDLERINLMDEIEKLKGKLQNRKPAQSDSNLNGKDYRTERSVRGKNKDIALSGKPESDIDTHRVHE